ncbi:MAG: ABC transporter ATP-binding protein [Finegoldia magna]|uniref:Multidrug ABC transporter n=1 Tax=Finegoldia magna (strain ATCC 29328 / DSM 20472 / WAL 2508) TaxID=334413 RepID=B0S3I5_FINM2|nr:ABC transporter ATP-binding protein [Finegoldia magna]EXF27877.1 multidrug ABC transporter [Finegoldia magna ALB8]MDU5271978.1 ABC transporter ATP-binding protein [Finegoldia magna]MDU7140709.1 ABC transporter ATP-binding protein [Finegoldia magna]UEA69734.1 ABC transporter ATP-binding protein/permease [Finegoldia magna]BAG08925.1 multidrug ABC transporter [Finegoldia magna ATCC 29328]
MQKNLKLFKDTWSVLWKNYKKLIISYTLNCLFSAIFPLISIYASARMIDGIVNKMPVQFVGKWAVIALLSVFFVQIILALTNKIQNTYKDKKYEIFVHILSEKFNELDYKQSQDTDIIGQKSNIEQNTHIGEFGIIRVMYAYDMILESLLAMIGSLVLSYQFLVTKWNAPESFSFLNSAWINVLLIVVVVFLSWISQKFNAKEFEIWNKIAEQGKFGNRVFTFYCWEMKDKSRMLDTRMYRQYNLASNMINECGIFNPGGFFDRIMSTEGVTYKILSEFFSKLQVLLIYLVVVSKSLLGAISIGMLSQYLGSLINFTSNLSKFLEGVAMYKTNTPYAELMMDYLHKKSEFYNGSLTTEKRTDKKYEVEFKNVSFKYPGTDNWVLKNINLKFDLGKKLAIVGQNGCGKTTFVKLLIRFYDVTEGEILLNGIDIKKYRYDEYLKIFSVVFQDFNLFAYPLAQNIASGMDYDEEKVVQSLKDVGMYDDVRKWDKGLDTYLYKDIDENGISVSKGQEQKIAIARALYQDSPFLILDEPTASLDPISEAEIYEKLGEIIKDRTAIFISHRLSSCKFSDKIIVFDKGEIAETGDHDSLISKNGMYKKLWDAQAEFYV